MPEAIVKAIQLVNNERNNDYGHPADDFMRVAGMMNGIGFRFKEPNGKMRELSAKDVPIFMLIIKLCREVHKHKEDNLVDIHGYTNTLEMVYEREEELKKSKVELSVEEINQLKTNIKKVKAKYLSKAKVQKNKKS
jgi:hypothetical protein